jgi:MFS family permease
MLSLTQLGGLGLSPPTIGLILSAYGVLNGIFQICLFAKIHNKWGTKNVFFVGMATAIPVFLLFPVMNTLATWRGVGPAVWAIIGVQTVLSLGLSLCYGGALSTQKFTPTDVCLFFRLYFHFYRRIRSEQSESWHC